MIQITKVPERTEQKTDRKTFFPYFFLGGGGGVTSLLATYRWDSPWQLPTGGLRPAQDPTCTNAKLAKQGTLPGQLPARDPPC